MTWSRLQRKSVSKTWSATRSGSSGSIWLRAYYTVVGNLRARGAPVRQHPRFERNRMGCQAQDAGRYGRQFPRLKILSVQRRKRR